MADRSLYTNAGISVANHYRQAKEAPRPHAVPYMEEKVPRQQGLERYAEMTPEQRKTLRASVGWDRISTSLGLQ